MGETKKGKAKAGRKADGSRDETRAKPDTATAEIVRHAVPRASVRQSRGPD